MTDLWTPVLEKLPLSRAEQAAVKRYQQDPMGRGFLPVADILRAHRRIEESLEILAQGVERHPTFTVARVVLARELLARGLVMQSWQTLEDSPQPLDDNILAQKLKFRLSILMSNEFAAKQLYQQMQRHQMLDRETTDFGEMLSLAGLKRTRERLILDYSSNGTDLVLPSTDDLEELTLAAQPKSETHSDDEDEPDLKSAQWDSFHVVPLNEVFQGADADVPLPTSGGLELDSTTLADLYCKQGHFGKALAIYRRLLRMTPNNDFLRRKTKEIALMERDQRSEDLTVDPSVVDQMEALEIIEMQSKFFDDLLERLTRQSD